MLGRNLFLTLSNKTRSLLRYRPYSIVNESSKENTECCLSGFSMYSSRKDLEILLGSYKPKFIDPLLSRNTLDFVGAYFLRFNTNDELAAFKSEIDKRKELVTYKIGNLNIINDKNYLYASSYNVTNKTVKCDTENFILPDHLLFLFEDFKLSRSSIRKCENNSKKSEINKYLLHFRSPEEAELAFVEKNFKLVLGSEINLSVYQC